MRKYGNLFLVGEGCRHCGCQILAVNQYLNQWGTDYAQLIITGTPLIFRSSDSPGANINIMKPYETNHVVILITKLLKCK